LEERKTTLAGGFFFLDTALNRYAATGFGTLMYALSSVELQCPKVLHPNRRFDRYVPRPCAGFGTWSFYHEGTSCFL